MVVDEGVVGLVRICAAVRLSPSRPTRRQNSEQGHGGTAPFQQSQPEFARGGTRARWQVGTMDEDVAAGAVQRIFLIFYLIFTAQFENDDDEILHHHQLSPTRTKTDIVMSTLEPTVMKLL